MSESDLATNPERALPDERRPANLGRRVASGAAWLISLRLGLRLLGLINIAVLARLLVPEDFGLLALAMAAHGILTAMTEFRPDLALIREQRADRRYYDTAWTLSVLRGALMATILAVGATFYAEFFDEPRLVLILYVFALSALIEGFQNVGIVEFFKELELQRHFRFIMLTRVIVIPTTWIVAFLWRNYWALVVGAFLEHTLPAVLSYRFHSYRPSFSLSVWRQIGSFSMWLMLNNFLTFLNGRSSTFVLGKLVGPATLGSYALALRVIYLPGSEIVAPIRQAVYPGYAKLAGDVELLKQAFTRVFGLVLLAVMPVTVALGLVIDPFVIVFFGEKWTHSVSIMQVLVVSGVLKVATANAGPALLALGRVRTLSLNNFLSFLVLIPLLFVGVNRAGAVGAAWAVAASSATALILDVGSASRALGVGLGALWTISWRPLMGIAMMVAAVKLVDFGWQTTEGLEWSAVRLVALSGVAGATYAASVAGFWRVAGSPSGAERDIADQLSRRLSSFLPWSAKVLSSLQRHRN